MGVAGFPERFCEWAAGNYFKLKVFAIRSQLVLKKINRRWPLNCRHGWAKVVPF